MEVVTTEDSSLPKEDSAALLTLTEEPALDYRNLEEDLDATFRMSQYSASELATKQTMDILRASKDEDWQAYYNTDNGFIERNIYNKDVYRMKAFSDVLEHKKIIQMFCDFSETRSKWDPFFAEGTYRIVEDFLQETSPIVIVEASIAPPSSFGFWKRAGIFSVQHGQNWICCTFLSNHRFATLSNTNSVMVNGWIVMCVTTGGNIIITTSLHSSCASSWVSQSVMEKFKSYFQFFKVMDKTYSQYYTKE